jgi:organic hydroperoxide reductase OsmC/OhrA
MHEFPHIYRAEMTASPEGALKLESSGLDTLWSAAPKEFDGPGDQWSPETLLVAAVVDCFGLTFRAVARASSFEWIGLRCEGTGELDRVDRTTRFTRIALRASLDVPAAPIPRKPGDCARSPSAPASSPTRWSAPWSSRCR